MSAAHRCNIGCVAGCGEPVVDGGPDSAALDRRVAGSVMAGDQQEDALPSPDRLFDVAVDGGPGAIQIEAVKIDHAVWFDCPAAQSFVPGPVQRSSMYGGPLGTRFLRRHRPGLFWRSIDLFRISYRNLCPRLLTRERTDRRSYPCPKLRLLRAERTHEPRRPWG